MSRKLIIILCCCFTGATLLVITLYATTRKVLHERNSFIREYAKMAAVKSNEFDLGFNSYYIAGITSEHIYLGNITAPFRIVVANLTLTDTQHVRLRIKGMDKPTVYQSATVKIEPPYFYIADGIKPAVYRGKIGEWVAERFMPHDTYFSQLLPLSNSSFVIRTNIIGSLNNTLGRVQPDTPYVRLEPTLLERQVDGIFCTDGTLNYNRDLNKLIYTYYYRNEFVVCDTNLNLDYRGHTIDTFSRAQIKVGHITSSNTTKLTYRKYVNRTTATSGKYLFVNSNLLARNDPKNIFPRMSIIDVYNLTNNTYRFSFTLPNTDEETKVREFHVIDNKTLFAMSGHNITRYDLRTDHFQRD